MLAAITIAAPVIQGIGRLRCLVQGCCHGRVAESVPGIRYTDPHSRVCRLANLSGVPVHATPLYSILWNVVVELALLRLVQLNAPCTLICGIYLLLSSAGRFVEEAYRGEPQTATIAGLHLYQWIAVCMSIAGAVVTTVNSSPATALDPLASEFRSPRTGMRRRRLVCYGNRLPRIFAPFCAPDLSCPHTQRSEEPFRIEKHAEILRFVQNKKRSRQAELNYSPFFTRNRIRSFTRLE